MTPLQKQQQAAKEKFDEQFDYRINAGYKKTVQRDLKKFIDSTIAQAVEAALKDCVPSFESEYRMNFQNPMSLEKKQGWNAARAQFIANAESFIGKKLSEKK